MNLHEEVCFTSFSVYILIYIYYSLLHDNPKSVSTGNKCVQELVVIRSMHLHSQGHHFLRHERCRTLAATFTGHNA